MCDKKNSVLFTKTECLVLSPDFKLLDESQVLLKVPRQDNMYSFDLKNAWSSKLLKLMNKLVRRTLLGGLLQAFLKLTPILVLLVRREGKQHKAFGKTKIVSSIRAKPLHIWHYGLVLANIFKTRLDYVAQGYTQEEQIDYDDVFTLVARIEAIRGGVIAVSTSWFEILRFPDKVYKVEKALYGLHQAPRAWKAKRTTKISQSSGPIHLVTDETVYKEWEDIMEKAATTASSLEAEQGTLNTDIQEKDRNKALNKDQKPFRMGMKRACSGPRCQETILEGAEAQTRFEAASK
ncbi:hypothetical protein Tco_1378400 [Tanacetum coccineum]